MVDFEHLRSVLAKEGEVHATLDGHTHELEIRLGQFDMERDKPHFTIETENGKHYFDKESVLSFYVPQEVWH